MVVVNILFSRGFCGLRAAAPQVRPGSLHKANDYPAPRNIQFRAHYSFLNIFGCKSARWGILCYKNVNTH